MLKKFLLLLVMLSVPCSFLFADLKELKALIKSKDYSGAEKMAQEMLKDKDIKEKSEIQMQLMTVYEKQKEFDKAIAIGEELIKDSAATKIDKFYEKLAKTYDKAKKQLKAVEIYKAFIVKFPEHKRIATFHYATGKLYQKMKQAEEAKTEFNLVITKYPDTKDAENAQKALDKLAGKKDEKKMTGEKKPEHKAKAAKPLKTKAGDEEEEE